MQSIISVSNLKKSFKDHAVLKGVSFEVKKGGMVISVAIPAVLMLIFINVFGGSMDVGGYNFANFIVPGILVNVLVQSSTSTGVGVNEDMNNYEIQGNDLHLTLIWWDGILVVMFAVTIVAYRKRLTI
ncbi:MAG: hypothetical protein FWB80_05255 [Defluviitaleaceae bacterium]|nr:hypothetical protein [Defluviitaleaceae bacterium]